MAKLFPLIEEKCDQREKVTSLVIVSGLVWQDVRYVFLNVTNYSNKFLIYYHDIPRGV